MKPFTPDDARQCVVDYARHLGRPPSRLSAYMLVAVEILAHYLSPRWAMVHAMKGNASDFLRPGAYDLPEQLSSMDRFRWMDRVIGLAEMLVNFESIEGMDGRVHRLLTDNLETGAAELEAAQFLHMSAIPFRFLVEKPSEKTPDVEAVFGERQASCEIKCKIEGTALGENTIRDTLETARRQLPTDKPGIVFLKIPEEWARDQAVQEQLEKALNRVFKSTGRVSAIIVRWEVWLDFNGPAARMKLCRTYHNPNARHSLADLGKIVSIPLNQSLWRRIPEMIGQFDFDPSSP